MKINLEKYVYFKENSYSNIFYIGVNSWEKGRIISNSSSFFIYFNFLCFPFIFSKPRKTTLIYSLKIAVCFTLSKNCFLITKC